MTNPVDGGLPTDSINRRRFVRLGALALGGVVLTDPLTQQAHAVPGKATAVIQVFLSGGPSQVETFDPKPGAAPGYAGPLKAIQTNVAGVQLAEVFPLLARQMDKVSIVRSVTHGVNTSSTAQHLMFTGYLPVNLPPTSNERPALGDVVAAVKGARSSGVPAYVNIPRILPFATGAYVSVTKDPFEVSDPYPGGPGLRTIRPPVALDKQRLANLAAHNIVLQGMQRAQQTGLTGAALDAASNAALLLATSSATLNALNVEAESAKVRASYGATAIGEHLLLARRLVQAGVTFVTVEDPGWAMNSNLEPQIRQKGPALDQALSALVQDLSSRGMLGSVLVVVYGEFGRSGKLNNAQGRDDSGSVFSVLFAGGGLKGGVVVGSSDANGVASNTSPQGPGDVLATIYSALGISLSKTFPDFKGLPAALLPQGAPIKALF